MQILEQLTYNEMVEEGSTISESDYNEFMNMVESICNKLDIPKDDKLYAKNQKAITTAKKFHLSSVSIHTKKGRKKGKDGYEDVSKMYINDLIQYLYQSYKLKPDNHWVYYDDSITEIGFEKLYEINVWGPIGNESWVNLKFNVCGKEKPIETSTITIKISKNSEIRMKTYERR